ncbi:TRAP transporter large permease [Sedimentitalea sp. XS_ASV28]|uniref:TRAP transporter large permease n=1 Tax=Sedimentitalea sp. XS_ASV28 TaxID=3241296 RepID=UPI0035144AB4
MSATAWTLLVTFAGGMLLGAPVAVVLGLAAIFGLLVADYPLIVFAQRLVAGTQVFTLLAIPGFILMGELMMRGGLSRRLVNVGDVLVRHITGGLGMVTVVSATFFAAISGSAPATTAAIGGIMIPEMERRGWQRRFSAALATASGPIGQMIPPSIPMIIWGVVSEDSITKLFLAGIIPGLLIAIGLIGVSYVHARRNGILREANRATGREIRRALWDAKWSLLAPFVILGGIYGGVFTPTEASAIGVVYALIVGFFVHRELKLADLGTILHRSIRTTTIVCFIIATASAFGWLVAFEQLPATIANAMLSISDNWIVILLLINLMLLIIGALMDNIAAMIILGAILTTIADKIGIDPIQFGAMVVINLAIGMATPPFGYSLFIGSAISDVSIEKITVSIWPMILVMVFVLMLVAFVPPLTLLLPSLFG